MGKASLENDVDCFVVCFLFSLLGDSFHYCNFSFNLITTSWEHIIEMVGEGRDCFREELFIIRVLANHHEFVISLHTFHRSLHIWLVSHIHHLNFVHVDWAGIVKVMASDPAFFRLRSCSLVLCNYKLRTVIPSEEVNGHIIGMFLFFNPCFANDMWYKFTRYNFKLCYRLCHIIINR